MRLNFSRTDQIDPSIFFSRKCTVLACADHGVAANKISAFDENVTVQMIKNYLIHRGAAANVFSNFAESDLFVVDVGIKTDLKIPGLIDRKISYGTHDFSRESAMTRDQAVQSVEIGRDLVRKLSSEGYKIFLPAEMGIGNTTSSAAITSAICQLPPELVTGRGTNISDDRLRKKIQLVAKSIEINQPNSNDGIDVLQKVGGFELGCLAGVMVECAEKNLLVILDGFNTFAAALIAEKIRPDVKKILVASQISKEPGQKFAAEILDVNPCLNLNLRFGETSGSSIVAKFLDIVYKKIPPDEKNFSIDQIPYDESEAKYRIDHFAKPIDSLGIFEDIAISLAAKKNVDKLLDYALSSLSVDNVLKNSFRNEIVRASVKMLLEMKTFQDSEVDPAVDGAGKSRQSNAV